MAVCVVGVILLMHRLVSPALSSQARSLLLAASLLFAPLLLNIGALQLGPLLALILAVAAYGFVRTRRAYPGVALGFGGVLRLSPLLLVVLFIRRPRDILSAPVVAAVTTTAGGVLLMLLLIPYTLEFVLRVLPKLSQGSAYFDNLSLSGVLMRGQLLATHRVGPWTARLAQLLGVALVAITWWRCRSARGERQRAVAFAAVLATLPIVSPLTWSHHLVLEDSLVQWHRQMLLGLKSNRRVELLGILDQREPERPHGDSLIGDPDTNRLRELVLGKHRAKRRAQPFCVDDLALLDQATLERRDGDLGNRSRSVACELRGSQASGLHVEPDD